MNRFVLGIPLLILTFSTGYFAVWYLHCKENQAESTPPTRQHQFTVLTKYVPVAVPTPEFRHLASLDQIAYPEFNTNLVDIFEHGNNYRKDEAAAKSGQTWTALFENNGKASLENVKVTASIDRSNSEYEDEVWVRLSIGDKRKPVFIVRGIDAIKTGQVTNLYHRPSAEEVALRNLPIKAMEIGYREQFYLNDNAYLLRVTLGELEDGTKANVLVLENNGISQIITYNPHYDRDDTIGKLLWVGDLDRDGKLDLYFDDYGYEKGSFGTNLFLSSQAEPGKLVKLAASFSAAGC